jgi:hypothetical protein
VDGVAMGLPLAPSLANAFMCHHEDNWLRECPLNFKPLYYRRYVDDTFVLFKTEQHAEQFLHYLNEQHPNIEFTLEKENNNSLAFLDILITKTGMTFTSSVFRKPTFTGLGLNFFSYMSSLYKINSIKTLIERAYKICSSYQLFHQEIVQLKSYFANNKFPLALFDSVLSTFLNKKHTTVPEVNSVSKLIKYVKLPYYGNQTFQIRNEIQKVLKENFPYADFRLIFVNYFKTKSLFNYKDKIPEKIQSNIVYQYTCSSCNAGYIGSTERLFFSRIQEHLGNSFRTFRPIAKPNESSIRDHSHSLDHPMHTIDFRIIDSAQDTFTLRLTEAVHIKQKNPTLNKNTTPLPLNTM